MWFLLSQLRKVAVSGAKITAKESRTSGLLLLTVVIRLRERRSPDATTVLSSCPVCWLFYILCVLLVAGISATGHLQQHVMHAFTHPSGRGVDTIKLRNAMPSARSCASDDVRHGITRGSVRRRRPGEGRVVHVSCRNRASGTNSTATCLTCITL